MIIFGFFIVNIYGSRLASVFVTKLFEPPLETKEDMIQAKLKILMVNHEAVYLGNRIQPQEFRDLIVPADVDEVSAYRTLVNSSYGYVVPDDKALFFLLEQKYRKRRVVLYTKVCISTAYLGFYMPMDSPFKIIFTRVILQTHQSGLYSKWYEDAFDETIEAGIHTRRMTVENTETSISVAHLTLAWTVLLYGLSCSLVCFFIEIIPGKYLLYAFNNLKCE
ncbi:unnamed protein product [Hermetia illucens]|uniref:Uncharacterized protein n=1 Tax=Hermetia illucens TaxID=343691 RepID=A0A7R8UA52_HERIL|nr:unnamed protein product [Hermetia illucens]